jgi:hypothetical protein
VKGNVHGHRVASVGLDVGVRLRGKKVGGGVKRKLKKCQINIVTRDAGRWEQQEEGARGGGA